MSGSLAPVLYWGVRTTLCSALVRCRAVSIPDCNATGQDALDGAVVERFEDLGTHARWERAVWCAIEIASSGDLLWWYANYSGSRVSGMMVLM